MRRYHTCIGGSRRGTSTRSPTYGPNSLILTQFPPKIHCKHRYLFLRKILDLPLRTGNLTICNWEILLVVISEYHFLTLFTFPLYEFIREILDLQLLRTFKDLEKLTLQSKDRKLGFVALN